MRPLPFLLLALLVVSACAPPPTPVTEPSVPPPPPPPTTTEEKVIGTVKVTASALNVRKEPSTDAEVVTQVKKGAAMSELSRDESWVKVRLADGATGFVSARFVSREGQAAKAKPRKGCPADSDFAFAETPTLAFSDSGAHGLVVVEASVNSKGSVTATKILSNSTGDEALAFLAEREIKSARFSPPIRNCVARGFIFTYRRTF